MDPKLQFQVFTYASAVYELLLSKNVHENVIGTNNKITPTCPHACYIQWHVIYSGMLYAVACYMQWHVIYSGMLYTVACYIQWHVIYSGMLNTVACYIQRHVIYNGMLYTTACYIQLHVRCYF